MADSALLAEAHRRGLLPPDKAAAFEEAQRRGLMSGAQPEQAGGVLADVGAGLAAPFQKLGQDVLDHYRMSTARMNAPPPSLGRAVMDTAGDIGAAGRTIADVVGLVGAPINGAVNATAGALSRYGPTAYTKPTLTFVNGRPVITPSRPMAQPEAQQALSGDISTALSAAAPSVRAPVMGPVRGPATPMSRDALRTAKRAGGAVARALQRDGMTPADVMVRAQANPGAPMFQSGGDNLTGLAEVAAQTPGHAQTALTRSIQDHAAQTPDRVLSNVGEALGGKGDYFASLEAAQAQRKAAAMPHRDQAFSTPLDDTAAKSLAPVMARVPGRAIGYALRIAKQDGFTPEQLGVKVTGVDANDLPIVQEMPTAPNMQFLHYVKKGLDQELDGLRSPVSGRLDLEGNPMAASTNGVRSSLARTMRDVSPAYDKFMQTWGDESGHVNALRLGRDVFSSSPEMSFEKLQGVAKGWSPAEQTNYAKGVGEALVAQIRSAKGGVGSMRQLLKSREFQDRASLAFPDKGAFDDFMARADNEVQMQARNNRVLGNSRTFGRQAAMDDLQRQQGVDPLDMVGAGLESGLNPVRLTGKALQGLIKSLPRKDRSVLGNPQVNQALGGALSDPQEFEKLMKSIASTPKSLFAQPISTRALVGAPASAAPLARIPSAKEPANKR